MNYPQSAACDGANFTLRNYLPGMGAGDAACAILEGLTSPRKRISSMFFYDAAGSKLFEEITRLPEYYPTRTEKKLLGQIGPSFFDKPESLNIVEIGSGDCSKISILLGAIPPQRWSSVRYMPVDVSDSAIRESADELRRKFPGVEIEGIVADFTRQLHHIPDCGNRLFCFLGSTLGNLSREQEKQFFLDMGRIMCAGDTLLLGVDMIKEADILERAYNDSQGVTAAFNRNILNVVNQIVGADFDPESFEHLAFFNHDKDRVEMHLRAIRPMRINCTGHPEKIEFREGETIHTENSHKYTNDYVRNLAATGGLEIQEIFTDEKRWFSLIRLLKI